MIKTIDITYGLPASGKTDWSRDQSKNDKWRGSDVYHIELDNYIYGYDYENKKLIVNSAEILKSIVEKSIKSILDDRMENDRSERLIIDGLFTTNDSIIKMIETIKSFKSHYKKIDKFRIIQFNGDVETCLWNDKGRFDRFGNDKNAKVSIKNIPLEPINWEMLKSAHRNSEIININVHKKPLIKNFLNSDGSDYNRNTIESNTWYTGGTWRNCWGDGGDIEPQEPETIIQLMTLLEKCNASHLYDEIITNIAIEEDDDESDYYGGCARFSWYVIHIEALENYLRERGHLRNLLITDLVGNE